MERFNEIKQERNIEKDAQVFMEAVANISIEEIPTLFDEVSVKNLAENIAATKLFILGEMHGVKENADVIYTLFKKFGFRQLALEWEPALQHAAEKFFESGALDFEVIEDSPDGRITAGHFVLIKKLHEEGLLESLVCFDKSSGAADWNERDATMAENIIATLSNTPTLVVAGRLHTKTESFISDGETDELQPMGEAIKQTIPNIASGTIEYLAGQFHNFGIHEFENRTTSKELATARFYQDENGCYVFELPTAHAATVPNPNEV
jgi:hypothetical protein